MTVTENGMAHYSDGDELWMTPWADAEAGYDVLPVFVPGYSNVHMLLDRDRARTRVEAPVAEIGQVALSAPGEAEELLGERGILVIPHDQLGFEAA